MIEFTLLGTSALLPLPDRALTAGFLRCMGRGILFDCGEGTQAAARRAGVSLMDCDIIALTHYHGDHIFGLPGMMQTLFSMGRTLPLTILGPEGLHNAMAPILSLAGSLSYPVFLREAGKNETLALKDLCPSWHAEASLTAIATSHRVPSRGYAFVLRRGGRFLPQKAEALGLPRQMWGLLQKGETVTVDGRAVTPQEVTGPPRRGLKAVFSGDTMPCPALTEHAAGADLFVCEGTYGEDADAALAAERGHMTFAQAGQTARDAGAERLWLCHYSQRLTDPEACLPAARAFFPDAVCGTDGMRILLVFSDGGEEKENA